MGLSFEIPDELVDVVAERVLERLNGGAGGSPWLTRAQAAEYMGVPVSRLEKDRRVPSHRWEGRVLYHRGELDAFLLEQGAS